MTTIVRRIVRKVAALPRLGRAVRIARAVVRLPELALAVAELRENQAPDTNLTRSTPVALRRLTRQLHELRERLDAAGIGAAAPVADASPAGIPAAPAGMPVPAGSCRVYIGSGEPAPAGYLNVAAHAGPGIDIASEPGALPLAPGQADEIRLAYQLEMCTDHGLRHHVLPHLHACLRQGGTLRAQVIDAGAAIRAYANGGAGFDDLRGALFGASTGDGRAHLNMFTPASLTTLLRDAGFDVQSGTEDDARAGRPYSFEIVAVKSVPAPIPLPDIA